MLKLTHYLATLLAAVLTFLVLDTEVEILVSKSGRLAIFVEVTQALGVAVLERTTLSSIAALFPTSSHCSFKFTFNLAPARNVSPFFVVTIS